MIYFICILLATAFVVFLGILLYYFRIAFVKIKKGDLEDLNHIENSALVGYRDIVQDGMDFIKNHPHEWLKTKSFDRLNLFARYYDNCSEKTILLFHGYRSVAARDFSVAVKMYSDLGFNVLLVDQRSHGRSDGKLITFGVKESYDVISWINYLNNNYGEKQLALGGMSMGATTVLLSCGRNLPQNVKCVVADCGFTSPCEIIKLVAKRNFKVSPDFFLPVLNLCCLFFGNFSIYRDSTLKAVEKSQIPILLIHGKDDGFVPCEMSERLYNSAKDKAEIVLVDGADHGMAFLFNTEKVYTHLKNFLDKNFCK